MNLEFCIFFGGIIILCVREHLNGYLNDIFGGKMLKNCEKLCELRLWLLLAKLVRISNFSSIQQVFDRKLFKSDLISSKVLLTLQIKIFIFSKQAFFEIPS